MNNFSKFFLAVSLTVSVFSTTPAFSAGVLYKNELQQLLKAVENKQYNDFTSFLDTIYNNSVDQELKKTISLFENRRLKTEADWNNIYRLLGIYTRVKYKDEMIAVLSRLVAIPTDLQDGIPQHKNPGIIAFGEQIEKVAKEYGLEYRNIDNHIFEVILKGNGKGTFGVYTHGDVVPADKSKWILENGIQLDPYQLKIIDGKMYGRGTEDDKCSIVTSLFAMKVIKENKLELKRDIHLIIETTEETSGEGFEYYKKKYPVPEYNIVLDSKYPIVTAEKGFGVISARFPVKGDRSTVNLDMSGKPVYDEQKESKPVVIDVTGGLAYNQVPTNSTALIRTTDSSGLKKAVDTYAKSFISENGGNFKISVQEGNRLLSITVSGVSAHSSQPETGINPVARMYLFLNLLNDKLGFQPNHFTNAAKYVSDNFGLDYFGKKLGIDYSNDFMGPLLASLTVSRIRGNELEVAVNTRSPKGKEPDELKKEIFTKLEAYRKKNNTDFNLDVSIGEYMYRNPQGKWINTLLEIFGDVTGREAKPQSSSGGTTAKQLPNGVSFGPSMPDEKYMGHNDNEFKKIENFLLDAQMFTEMFMRIGNLEEME